MAWTFGAFVDVNLAIATLPAWFALALVIGSQIYTLGPIETGRVDAHIHWLEASVAREAGHTIATITIDQINASCIVSARISQTLVNI